jgi:hypothetical protein
MVGGEMNSRLKLLIPFLSSFLLTSALIIGAAVLWQNLNTGPEAEQAQAEELTQQEVVEMAPVPPVERSNSEEAIN